MGKYILHEDVKSLNCYKVRLVAAMTGHQLTRKSYNILKGETRTADFLTKVSAGGRIPVLQVDDTTFLPESNAACYYLADAPDSSTKLIPEDRLRRAQMMQWMFFEQNEHEINVAGLRFWKHYIGLDNLDATKKAQVPVRAAAGTAVLERMNTHLAQSESGWFVGNAVTLADLILYAYTHVAEEAGFELVKYSHIQRWIVQVERLDGYVPASL